VLGWVGDVVNDLVAVAASALLIAGYYLYLWWRHSRDPNYTIHGVNDLARTLWVEHVMADRSRDVMAVQTLRNYTMAATFMASSAALLVIGTLTLTGQGENLARTWHALNVGGSHAAETWLVKVMCLLTAFVVAFFAFAMTIRLLNHVVFMINVPNASAHPGLAPADVAHRLRRAGHFYTVGMRAFLLAVPLAFWLFGPLYLVAAASGLVIVLHQIERRAVLGGD
jgi:uncharacterized membrane protein